MTCHVLSSFVVAREAISEGKEGSRWLLPVSYWQRYAVYGLKVEHMPCRLHNTHMSECKYFCFYFLSFFLFHQHPRWYHISIDSVTVGDRFSVLCDRKPHVTEVYMVQGFVCCSCAEILSLWATWYSWFLAWLHAVNNHPRTLSHNLSFFGFSLIIIPLHIFGSRNRSTVSWGVSGVMMPPAAQHKHHPSISVML